MKCGKGELEIEVAWNDDREHWVKTNRVFAEECGGIKISELTNEQVEEANAKAIQAFARYLQDVRGIQEIRVIIAPGDKNTTP